MRTCFSAIAVVYYLSWGVPACRAEELILRKIVSRIEEQELLYRNLDLKYSLVHESDGYKLHRPSDQVIKTARIRLRNVVQNAMYRIDVQQDAVTHTNAKADHSEQVSYDGEKLRYSSGAVFNFENRRLEKGERYSIHSPFLGRFAFLPLSLFLKSGDAMRQHPGAAMGYDESDVVVKAIVNDVVDGLSCLRLDIQVAIAKTGRVHDYVTLWISPQRNYLPVKCIVYKHFNREVPLLEWKALSWREVRPEIWMYETARVEHFSLFETPPSKRVRQTMTEFRLEDINLEPNHPVSFFQAVTPQPGQVVYELQDGKVVNSYRVRSGWMGPVLAAAVVLAMGLLAVMLIRRRQAGAAA